MKQGSVVQFGESNIFRFNHPTEAIRLKELRDQGLLPPEEDASNNMHSVQAQRKFEELQRQEQERIAGEQARIAAEQERIAAEAARVAAAEAAIAEQARLQAAGQSELAEGAERNRVMAAQIEADRVSGKPLPPELR